MHAYSDLVAYVKAGYPVLYMVTPEEGRAEHEIYEVAKNCNRNIIVWSASEGIRNVKSNVSEKCPDPVAALRKIIDNYTEDTIIVMRDMHPYFKNPMVVRLIRDIGRDFKQNKKTLFLLSPVNQLPDDLERDVVVVDFDLPTKDQLADIWNMLYESSKSIFTELNYEITEDEKDRILTAAAGLTSIEAENAFAKATVIALNDDSKPPISDLVMKEKAMVVKKSGILEYFETSEDADSIGGLDQLKKWLHIRSKAFSKEAREYGLPSPKGILLIGLPGCGKSMTAKAASNILRVPLIRFDISRVFGGIVGQSEQQMRAALQTIDRIGNCVVWIDEAEKVFAGIGGGGSTDSGVTKRVFGNFLTYMQEKEGQSFVIMTVNNIQAIQESAPEMLRKGRFDEIFFVGLPSDSERAEIFKIHIAKYGRDPEHIDIDKLVQASSKFSGAEIEQAVVEGLYNSFYDNAELSTEHIEKACQSTNPLAKSSETALNYMKEWAQTNAVNASINGTSGDHAGRKLEI